MERPTTARRDKRRRRPESGKRRPNAVAPAGAGAEPSSPAPDHRGDQTASKKTRTSGEGAKTASPRTRPTAARSPRRAPNAPLEPSGRVIRYLSALLVVCAAYWSYSLLVAPWIDPEIERIAAPRSGPVTGPVTELSQINLAQHFPDDAWQRNAKVLETKYGALVFGDDVREDVEGQSRIVLRPVTLLFVADGDGKHLGARPIILDAPKGIEVLTMTDDSEEANAFGIGAPDAGRLLGEVTIHREASPDKQDGFTLVTRNVQIDERRIATPYEVRFAMGPNYGVGKDLEIVLKRDDDETTESTPAAGDTAQHQWPIESIELVKLDKLVVYVEDKSKDSNQQSASLGPHAAMPLRRENQPPRMTPVEVTCAGPMRLSMADQVMTMEQQVNIARIPEQGVADVLSCELLEVHFGFTTKPRLDGLGMPVPSSDGPLARLPEANSELVDAQGNPVPNRGVSTNPESVKKPRRKLEIRKVVASGYPVRLISPSHRSEARGDQLIYEMANSMLSLTGADGVHLANEGQTIHARRLDYQFDVKDAKRVGQLWAAGPGRVAGTLGDNQPFTATWNKLLKAHPEGQQHVISLFEGVSLAVGSVGRFDAAQVHFYLNEVMKPPTARRPKPERQWLPDRLQASGDVRLQSPRLTLNTREVRAWFQPQVTQPRRTPPKDNKDSLLSLGDPNQANDPKLRASGDLVQLKLQYNNDLDITLDELQVQGQVDVQRIPVLPTDDTFRLQGDQLWLGGIEQEALKVRIVGRPARIDGNQSFIESGVVTLDQASNRVEAAGAGTLSIAQTLKTTNGVARGRATAGPPVTVAWKERLLFDGARITLRGGVRISGMQPLKRGEQMVFDGSADELEGVLARGIDLSDIQNIDKQEFEVTSVRMIQNVNFAGQTIGPGNEQLSNDKIQVDEVRFNPQTHVFTAIGPGWISSVRSDLKSTKSDSARVTVNSRAANPAQPKPPRMHYARVEFQDQVQGNAKIRDMQFSDRVRCIYGQVSRWDEVLTDGTTRGDQAAELSCRTLQLAELVRNGEKAMYINATGNIRIQSQQFDAHAARLTYDQMKDLMVLHGDPRGGATLQYSPTGAAGGAIPLNAQRIKFWPKKMNAEVEGFSSVSGSLGGLGSP